LDDRPRTQTPAALDAIERDAAAIGFTMASESRTGSLLRTLAASKPGGRFLELGTGTGVGTAWLLAGMDAQSRLDSVDSDERVIEIARNHLGGDPRVTFHLGDASAFLARMASPRVDFIYADAWPGKFTHLDLALSLLRPGGIYFVDDLLPQSNWPDDHPPKVASLVAGLENRPGFIATKLAWASGLMLLVRADSEK
jgi:predicted O-methyltransferase YrrM